MLHRLERLSIGSQIERLDFREVFIGKFFENVLRVDAVLDWFYTVGIVVHQNFQNFVKANAVPINNSIVLEVIDEFILRSVVLQIEKSEFHVYFENIDEGLHDLHHFLVVYYF